MTTVEDTDLLVIGAGPAGLTAATNVARAGHRVIVLDREQAAGGVPRHCFHTGFGIRDLHRVQTGPAYAGHLVARAQDAGVDVRTEWTATCWSGPTSMATTSPAGLGRVDAKAVLLATGCRERPRPARLVPGDRPAGILTAGALQQLVYLAGQHVGRRAVVVGVEHIAFSAVHTLHASGATVAAVITPATGLETFQALRAATTLPRRVPVLFRQRITGIHGHTRVTGITLEDTATGRIREIPCDTVVFTGDWVPDYELARAAALRMDPATRGPAVDTGGHTSIPGVFAAGNLQHPAEPADVAALGGAHVAGAIHDWLAQPNHQGDALGRVPIRAAQPLDWITPQYLRPGQPPARGRFILRANRRTGPGSITVTKGDTVLSRHRVPRLTPHRSLSIPAPWVCDLTNSGEVDVTFEPGSVNQPGSLGSARKLCVRP